MVTIRLTRSGARKRPFYRIVVTDSRKRRDGGWIEQLGFVNPIASGQARELRVDLERAQHWLAHGAKASERVRNVLRDQAKAEANANA